MRKLFLHLSIISLISCSDTPEGEPFWASADAGKERIVVSSALAGGESVSLFDSNGNFETLLKDYTIANFDPNGLVRINTTDFFVVLNGVDQIQRVNIFGETISTIENTNFNGNLYTAKMNGDILMFIESNGIECFNVATNTRIGNPCIPTTIGSCVLSAPRDFIITSEGNLLVANTGNDHINSYNISDLENVTCANTYEGYGNVNPIAMVQQTNGNVLIANQGDDAVDSFSADLTSGPTSFFDPGTTVLNNPTAMLEMSNGDILIASDGTNDIIRVDSSGNLVADPFMQSIVTGQVSSMILIGGDN